MADNKVPDHIKKIVALDDIESCSSYIHVLTDYLFDIMLYLSKYQFSTVRMAEVKTWIQMFFTNSLAVCKLLEGLPYEKSGIIMNPVIDHRMVFSLVRTIYEHLIIFEIVYILPSNDDKKELMYCLYEAAGYKEQLETLTREIRVKNPKRIEEIVQSYSIVKIALSRFQA